MKKETDENYNDYIGAVKGIIANLSILLEDEMTEGEDGQSNETTH